MLLPSLDVKDILLIASAYFSDMTKILFLNLFVVLYVKEFRKNKNKNMVIDVFVIIVAWQNPWFSKIRWENIYAMKKLKKPSKKQGDINLVDYLFFKHSYSYLYP